MKRIAVGNASETLITALENAENMRHVLILYDTKDGVDHDHGMFIDKEMDAGCMNYMLDVAKFWIFSE
jgi:hypothetical protein